MARLLGVEDFLKSIVPVLVNNKKSLSALFVSYNRIGEYEDGPVETDKEGLKVIIQNGYRLESPLAFAMIRSGDDELMSIGHQTFYDEGHIAQMNLERKMARVDLTKESGVADVLVVIYAGLRAFKETLAYAGDIREQCPDSTIVILTCDCDIYQKERSLDPLIASGEIDHVVTTESCGGRDASRKMVEGLIAAWPSASASQ